MIFVLYTNELSKIFVASVILMMFKFKLLLALHKSTKPIRYSADQRVPKYSFLTTMRHRRARENIR